MPHGCIGPNLLDTPEATRRPEKTEGRTDHSGTWGSAPTPGIFKAWAAMDQASRAAKAACSPVSSAGLHASFRSVAGPVIPRRVASQRSPLPFHRTKRTVRIFCSHVKPPLSWRRHILPAPSSVSGIRGARSATRRCTSRSTGPPLSVPVPRPQNHGPRDIPL